MAEQTLNLPSLFVVLVVLILSIRYFFFTGPSTPSRSPARDRNTANPEHIEQIAQMFPQLSRRDIQWDLQRNGGSVQATTERVLSGRGMERPPPSFQPLPPPASSSSNTPTLPTPYKSSHPDLLTRYKLHHRLSQPNVPRSGGEDEQAEEEKPKPPQWSPNRDERQALLQKRREDMVLAARRKLEEKEKERREKGAAAE